MPPTALDTLHSGSHVCQRRFLTPSRTRRIGLHAAGDKGERIRRRVVQPGSPLDIEARADDGALAREPEVRGGGDVPYDGF
jgi:hypothetical protein